VYVVDAHEIETVGVASALRGTTSLAAAQDVAARLTGISEIDYERRKAQRLQDVVSHPPDTRDLPRVDIFAAEARLRGADFVSVRRLAELIGVKSSPHLAAFRGLLAAQRTDRYRPPIYRT
jgi:hypothetical protein